MTRGRAMAGALLGAATLAIAGDAPPPAPWVAVAALQQVVVVTGDPGLPAPAMGGMIGGSAASAEHLAAYGDLFAAEFNLYPRAFVRRARLRRVVLCEGLAFDGQRRNAVPDWEHDALYLDVGRGTHAPRYLRKVIHHEFFHMVDYRDDGTIYGDDRWARLNPTAFRYGPGGRLAQGLRTTSVLTDAVPGFLNHYSTTAVEEDKAEIFANLVVDGGIFAARAARDPVLAAKGRRIGELVREFCPGVDAAFWARARRIPRAPG